MAINQFGLFSDKEAKEHFAFRWLFYTHPDFRKEALKLNIEALRKKMGPAHENSGLRFLIPKNWLVVTASIYETCCNQLSLFSLKPDLEKSKRDDLEETSDIEVNSSTDNTTLAQDAETVAYVLNKAVQIFELTTLMHGYLPKYNFEKENLQLFSIIGVFISLKYLYESEEDEDKLKDDLLGDLFEKSLFNEILTQVEAMIALIETLPKKEFNQGYYENTALLVASQVASGHLDQMEATEAEKNITFQLIGEFILENGTIAYPPYLVAGAAYLKGQELMSKPKTQEWIENYCQEFQFKKNHIEICCDQFSEILQHHHQKNNNFYLCQGNMNQLSIIERNLIRTHNFCKTIEHLVQIYDLKISATQEQDEIKNDGFSSMELS